MNAPLGQRADLAETLTASWGTLSAEERLRSVVAAHPREIVATTSFGAQAAVMLHLLREHAPEVPIVFIDTGYLFPETYHFAEQLIKTWDLNIHVYQSQYSAARLEALYGKLWEQGEKGAEKYALLTKVEPMNRALQDFGASFWLSGMRRVQAASRAERPFVEAQKATLKLYPILDWTDADVTAYMREHALPIHPLVSKGYVSIGDWHSTKPMVEGMSPEETRFDGTKRECGLHLPSDQQDFQI